MSTPFSDAPAPAPALARTQSLRNKTEEDGLRRALEIVQAQSRRLTTEDHLSPMSFCMGVLNVAASAFMLGRAPQLYWAYAGVKSVALNGVSYYLKRRDHQRLYLFDLCHVLSFAYTAASVAALVAWAFPETRPAVAPYTSSSAAFRAAFALANGPLGLAVPTLANALVLHSPRQTAALFIHISPPIVTWAMRWHPEAHEHAFPGILPVRELIENNHNDIAYEELVAPALRLYCAWWLLFAAWMMLDGRRRGNVGVRLRGDGKKTHDTVYHRTLGGAKANALGKLAGYDPSASHKKTPVAKYLLAHAVLCVALICVSPFFLSLVRRAYRVRVRAALLFRLERRAAVLLDHDPGVREAAQGAPAGRKSAGGAGRERGVTATRRGRPRDSNRLVVNFRLATVK